MFPTLCAVDTHLREIDFVGVFFSFCFLALSCILIHIFHSISSRFVWVLLLLLLFIPFIDLNFSICLLPFTFRIKWIVSFQQVNKASNNKISFSHSLAQLNPFVPFFQLHLFFSPVWDLSNFKFNEKKRKSMKKEWSKNLPNWTTYSFRKRLEKNEFTCITHNIDQNLKHINNAQKRREDKRICVCVRKQVYGFHKFDINFVVFFLSFFAFHQLLKQIFYSETIRKFERSS